MCEPTTIMMGVGLATGVAGSLISANGQAKAGQAAQDAAYQNAHTTEVAAGDLTRRGEVASGEARMKGTASIGDMRAAYGASGVDGTVGSPLAAMADVRMMSELDALKIKNNAAREAWGMQQDAKRMRTEGDNALKAGKNAALSTLLGGGGDALKGGAAAYGNYKKIT